MKILKYNKPLLFFVPFVFVGSALASEMFYVPQNPSFGGSVANGGYLLGLANAQKQFEEDDDKTALEDFNDRLQRSLLSRITSAVTRDVVDIEGNITPGIFETVDYTIEVIDEGGGTMTIVTTDKESGDQTIIQVQNQVE